MRTHNQPTESGVITVMVAILAITVLACGALVIDGGRLLSARREAANIAASAARTAAQELDPYQFETTNQVSISGLDAQRMAELVITQQGYDNYAINTSGDTVTVTITDEVPTALMTIFGIRTRTVTGTATATLSQQTN